MITLITCVQCVNVLNSKLWYFSSFGHPYVTMSFGNPNTSWVYKSLYPLVMTNIAMV